MTETERIADQLTRAIEGNAWHGPALMELLEDVNAQKASSKKIEGAHSIWEIVNHIILDMNFVTRRVQGEVVNITPQDDWTKIKDFSEQAWQNTIEKLKATSSKLKNIILDFPSVKLDDKIKESEQTYYLNLHGTIQHILYHAGQIAILKK